LETTTDHRKSAEQRVRQLIEVLEAQPPGGTRDALVDECRSLASAIAAFHMEGIRFRMFNVDRTLATFPLPADSGTLFGEVRRHLEAAGFQTRSHKAPG
jgi:hypothetical protein